MVFICGQLAMEPERADLRGILIADAMGCESLVDNRQCVFQRVGGGLANGEGIFAATDFRFEADVLHDDLIAQMAPVGALAHITILAWNVYSQQYKVKIETKKGRNTAGCRPAPGN
jgi:hypothetical protein